MNTEFAGWAVAALALFYNVYQSHQTRARLKVKASMSYGGDLRFGRENQHFLTVELTNAGGGIVRIRSFKIACLSKFGYRALKITNRFRKPHKRVQESVGVYSGSVNPIDEILSQPNVTSYPPNTIIVEGHETKEIRVSVAEALLPAMRTEGLLIVTDHLGHEHLAEFVMMAKKQM